MTCKKTLLVASFVLPIILLVASPAHADQPPATPPPTKLLKVTVIDSQDCESEFALGKFVVLTVGST